jgi:hypothetical protein
VTSLEDDKSQTCPANTPAQDHLCAGLPPAGWMRPSEVVGWIAFRNPLPLERWDEFSSSLLIRSWSEWGFTHGFILEQAELLLEAAEAKAAGRASKGPTRTVDALGMDFPAAVDSLSRRLRVSVNVFATELRHDFDAQQGVDTKLSIAHQKMMTEVTAEHLNAFGCRALNGTESDVSAAHEKLPATLFLRADPERS